MANYKPIGVPFDRTFRNDLNDNFKTLDGVASSAKADTETAKQAATSAAQSAQKAQADATSAKQASELAVSKADETQSQLDDIIIESGTSDAEVVQARGGKSLLYERFIEIEDGVSQRATLEDVEVLDNKVQVELSGKVGVLTENITVKIPSEFPTLQEAINTLSTKRTSASKTITLLIEAGHQPSKGVKVENGDYKHFVIASEDPIVTLSDDFIGHFLEARRADAPKLSCLIDANFKGWAGVWLDDQSQGFISPGAGVKNTSDRALYANKASTVWAEGAVFTGGLVQGLWVSRVSTAFVDYADFSGSGSSNASGEEPVSIHISRQSRVYGLGIKVRDSKGTAVKCQRGSYLSAVDGDFSRAKENGVQITGGSVAYLEGAKILETGMTGLISQGASNVHALSASVSAKAGNTSDGVLCENASCLDIDKGAVVGFGRYNIIVNRAGTVNASSTILSNSGSHGVHCEQGSVINLRSAQVKFSGGKDISILRGSTVTAFDCVTTNGATSPVLIDTNVTIFNGISGNQGVIWK